MVVFLIFEFLANLLQKSCHNSGISNDLDVKLGPVTKLDKRNTTTSEKLDDEILLAKDDIIVTF